jgi:hypothetical protein
MIKHNHRNHRYHPYRQISLDNYFNKYDLCKERNVSHLLCIMSDDVISIHQNY